MRDRKRTTALLIIFTFLACAMNVPSRPGSGRRRRRRPDRLCPGDGIPAIPGEICPRSQAAPGSDCACGRLLQRHRARGILDRADRGRRAVDQDRRNGLYGMAGQRPGSGMLQHRRPVLSPPGQDLRRRARDLDQRRAPLRRSQEHQIHADLGQRGPGQNRLVGQPRSVPGRNRRPHGRRRSCTTRSGISRSRSAFISGQAPIPSGWSRWRNRWPWLLSSSFKLRSPEPYRAVAREYKSQGYRATSGIFLKIQGEDAVNKSDSMLAPLAEQGDPTTEPYHPTLLRLNGIGGFRWNQAGQWITWKFAVPEDGLYTDRAQGEAGSDRGHFQQQESPARRDGAV